MKMPAVDHPRVRRVVELGLGLQEVAVVRERLRPVGDAALRAQVHGVGRDAVVVDRALAALGQHRAELAEVVVGVAA